MNAASRPHISPMPPQLTVIELKFSGEPALTNAQSPAISLIAFSEIYFGLIFLNMVLIFVVFFIIGVIEFKSIFLYFLASPFGFQFK